MNIENLAINNWVLYNGQPAQIEMLDLIIDTEFDCLLYNKSEHNITAQVSDLEPVPLTPKILEKNNFYIADQESMVWLNSFIECTLYEHENNTWTPTIREDCSIYIKYVHEFQNFLKFYKKWDNNFIFE